MVAIEILPTQTAHLAAICEIEQQLSPHPWTLAQFRESLVAHQCWSALAEAQLMGYILWSAAPGVDAELLNIGVHPNYHREGVGAAMLRFCLAQLCDQTDKLFLEVRATNFPAIQFYLRHDFVEVGRRRDYYRLVAGGREDALIMSRQIERTADV